MNEKLANKIFLSFLIVLLVIKIFLVMQTSTLSYNSYYEYRYIENFHQKFTPLIHDDLSYGGRTFFVNIFYYMFISIISFIIPALILLKYASVFLGLLAIYIIYKILSRLFSNKSIALSMSILAALLPTLFTSYFNSFSSGLLFWVLLLCTIYYYPDIEQAKKSKGFLISFIFLTLISPYSLLVIIGFLVYFLILRIESLPVKKSTLEIFLFMILFNIWYHLIFYKTALTRFGLSVLWQNMPDLLIQTTYQKLTLTSALLFIGIVPAILSLFGLYHVLFTKRNRLLLLVSSLMIVFCITLAIGIIPLYDGLIFLISTLIILGANGLNFILNYLKNTLFPKSRILIVILIIFLSLFNLIPVINSVDSIKNNSPNEDEILTMEFIKNNIPEHEIILGDVEEGHFITSQSERKNFYDTNFFLLPTADQRFRDAKNIFLSQSLAAVINQMNYYDITYIYISKKTRERYQGSSFLMENNDCFETIFETETTKVFKRKCDI